MAERIVRTTLFVSIGLLLIYLTHTFGHISAEPGLLLYGAVNVWLAMPKTRGW